jgi:hypothetical protein
VVYPTTIRPCPQRCQEFWFNLGNSRSAPDSFSNARRTPYANVPVFEYLSMPEGRRPRRIVLSSLFERISWAGGLSGIPGTPYLILSFVSKQEWCPEISRNNPFCEEDFGYDKSVQTRASASNRAKLRTSRCAAVVSHHRDISANTPQPRYSRVYVA